MLNVACVNELLVYFFVTNLHIVLLMILFGCWKGLREDYLSLRELQIGKIGAVSRVAVEVPSGLLFRRITFIPELS